MAGPLALDALFRPRSIAVIGASRTPGKLGHAVVRNLVRGGFSGRVFPINPAGGAIEGQACFRALADLPERAECAMVVIPASKCVAAVEQCAAAGVRAVVVGATGFAEMGTAEGSARQDALARIARERGMLLLGPNTNGFFNAADQVSLGYNAEHAERFPAGAVSVVAHSGALFGGFARTLRQLGGGLSKFIPVGNEAGVGMLDVVEYLIADASTRVIALVVEALSSGARLRRLAEAARRAGKPIVALKLGRSAVGVEATMAHSSRLAGKPRAYDALFAACGIPVVRSIEALAGASVILADRGERSVGGDQRLVCVSTSGAGGSLLADFAAAHGLTMAGDGGGEWQGRAGAAIAREPARGRLRNPIDTGSLGRDWSQVGDLFALLEADGITGPTAVYAHLAPNPAQDRMLQTVLIERRRRTATPIVVMAPGRLDAALEAAYVEAGIPVFHDLPTGFDSLRCHYASLPRPVETPAVRAAIELPRATGILDEITSADLLRQAGVPMVESRAFAAIAEGEDIAGRIGYPVVLKALAPGIAHKSAQGLVATGIADADALRRHFQAIERNLAAHGHARDAVTFIVQPMRRGEAEFIIGVSHEKPLGHFLVAGWGGVHAEALDQVSLLAIPAGAAAIRTWLEASPLARLLARLAAMDAVAAALAGLDALVAGSGGLIQSIDVNPLLVGRGFCVGVDALIVMQD